ncbi:hypothetical protein FHETE_6415 [Fusarium heterosporum]|uniref:Uncharacterized protein n=1 Tax=Fusarium heterosporum TaxID=42747 RepID=A0A8H5WN76_FUSHE|nr:hypothetical protein FHETE_6415 [Fusarium heterosporum]
MDHPYSLPFRPHPRTLTTEDTTDVFDSPNISNPPLSDLRVRKRASLFRQKLENLENNGTSMPIVLHDRLREKAQLDDSSNDRITKPPASEILMKQPSLLQMVEDNLRQVRSQTPSPEPKHEDARSTSSSYPEQGIRSPTVPSPDLDVRFTKFDLSNLTKYSRPYERISGLRSSSDSSAGARAMSQGSNHRALTSAITTFGKLQRLPTPSYRRFEVVSSSEDLAVHVSAPQNSIASQTSLENTVEAVDTSPLTRVKAHSQPGDLADRSHPVSPSPSTKPPGVTRPSKRKASSISLRGLTAGVKRSRVGLKKLVYNVRRSSCYKLRQVHDTIKRQRKEQKKQYAAWKAARCKLKPGDVIEGKHKKRLAPFSIEKGRDEDQSWWKAGVKRYRAPKWMRFGR